MISLRYNFHQRLLAHLPVFRRQLHLHTSRSQLEPNAVGSTLREQEAKLYRHGGVGHRG